MVKYVNLNAVNSTDSAWRIGINPLTWTNDDMPELGADTPLELCLAEAHLAGYAGIELGNKFPRDAARLKPLLQAHHLQLVSGWYSLRLLERSVEDEIEALTPHLSLLCAMGCHVFIAAETTHAIHGQRTTPVSQRPSLPHPSAWKTWCEKLTRIADHIASHGLTLAYHHHMGTVVQSADDVDLLMAHTGSNVGLLLDTGHLTLAGADPVDVLRRHIARTVHVHCKNIRKPVLNDVLHYDRSFLQAVLSGVFTVPGDSEGCVDFTTLLATLRQHHYAGWIVVEAEQDPARAHPLTYATLGYKAIQQLG